MMQAGALAHHGRFTARMRGVLAASLAALLLVPLAPAAEALGESLRVVIVGRDAGTTARLVEGAGGSVEHVLPIIDGVVAEVPEGRLSLLENKVDVFPDRAVTMQSASYGAALGTVYPTEVGATSTWADGNTGEGVTVALVDTGVAEVPDLADRVVATANFSDEQTHQDTYGHGTFQAGLIAGTGTSSDGAYVGVAPGADLLSVKVAGADGSTSLGRVLAGVQLVDHAAEEFGVRVALLAIDSESPLPPDLDPLSLALRRLWAHGVVVVVPAGNGGPGAETIASPGEDPWLLTAGSVDDLGTPEVDDDVPAESSARGPTRWGDDKPDLAAPGEHLVSVRAPGSTVDTEYASARVDDAYFRGSGTSMAAAVTAGAAALLLAERPGLRPDQVKALLTATATGIAAGEADATGAGVVDVAAAIAFDGDLPDLPDVPDLGDAIPPFTPPGLAFGWSSDDDGPARWGARRWDARQWKGDVEHAARQWAARQWTEDGWAARQWAARQWAARQWAARQWAARQWAARQWQEDRWEARQWAARQWNARQWNARQWNARQWNARQWNARQWNARQWSARQWSAEQWEARQWSARQWSARQWSARQWSARQWSARQWSARQWSSASWG